MKGQKQKELFIENLKKMPIVQVACKNTDIARATIYRWKKEDKEFEKKMEEAMLDGENFITDMSESQLISLIQSRNFPAVQLWLRSHHPRYGNKLEVSGNLKIEEEPLTVEQQALLEEALRLAGIKSNQESNKNGTDKPTS